MFKNAGKKLVRSLRILSASIGLLLILSFNVAWAQTTPAATPAGGTSTSSSSSTTPTGGAGSVIREIGGSTQLPSYDAGHASQNYQPGASKLTSTVYFILDFFKYVFGSVAVLMIVISGIKLVLAARAVQDVMSREKETIRFAFSGLLIILLADTIIRNVFFGSEGEMYRTGTDLQMAAQQGVNVVQGVTGMLRIFIPSIAILFFVIAAYRLLTSQGDPEKLKKAQTQITWAIVGIIVAGLAEIVVFNVIFPQQGSRIPDANEFARLMVTMTNYISGFISTIAVSMLIYAGYLYVVSAGGEGINKAKTVVKGAIIGLLIAMAAFALVNTFVKVEPITSTPTPVETTIPST
jgi:hypothetical protein